MNSEKFLSWPEIEETAKEITVLIDKNKQKIYTAIKQDPVFSDYIIRELARIMALAIMRIKDREVKECNLESYCSDTLSRKDYERMCKTRVDSLYSWIMGEVEE